MNKRLIWFVTATACLLLTSNFAQAKGPLKVFILAGQSNMQGHANVSTIGYLAKDPKTAPMYHDIMGANGKPKVCKNVWITYDSSGSYHVQGRLTTGFGTKTDMIGPELTFGIYMEKQLGEPILIIKTAWGGKSLNTDFRPPSGVDLAPKRPTGHYYKLMIQDVKKVLADPKKYCPAYNPKQGYQLAGFVWFQGWNDMVDRNIYPNRAKPGGYDLYTKLLGDFIRDVRRDLKAPKMPFVIGVAGVGGKLGPQNPYTPKRYIPIHQNFRNAMAATAKEPQFKDTVVNVQTYKCWDPLQGKLEMKRAEFRKQVAAQVKKIEKEGKKLSGRQKWELSQKLFDQLLAKSLTPAELAAYHGMSAPGFHYEGSAKILGCIGKHFAEAMYPLVEKEKSGG